MDRVALGVGEDLYLDMPRASYGLLNKRSRVTECPFCLAHGRSQGFPNHLRLVDSTHTATAAPGNSLDEHRKADLFCPRHQLVDVRRRRCGLQRGNAGPLGCLESPHLVTSELENAGGRTDEHDAGLVASPRQVGILAQEPIAGIDRVRAGFLGGPDDLGDIEVGAYRMSALADHVRLIGLDPVDSVAVLVGVHRDGLDAQLICSSEGPDSDLTAVGDQHLGEHVIESIERLLLQRDGVFRHLPRHEVCLGAVSVAIWTQRDTVFRLNRTVT